MARRSLTGFGEPHLVMGQLVPSVGRSRSRFACGKQTQGDDARIGPNA